MQFGRCVGCKETAELKPCRYWRSVLWLREKCWKREMKFRILVNAKSKNRFPIIEWNTQ